MNEITAEDSRAGRSLRCRHLIAIQWLLICLSITLLILGCWSVRRAFFWHSKDGLNEISIIGAGINLGWRPADLKKDIKLNLPAPGLSSVLIGDKRLHIYWWFERGANKYGRWLIVPVWIPVLLCGMLLVATRFRIRQVRLAVEQASNR